MEEAVGLTVRTFSETFVGERVHFYVLRLKQSFLVWVGTDTTFSTLAVAMNTRFVSVESVFMHLVPKVKSSLM